MKVDILILDIKNKILNSIHPLIFTLTKLADIKIRFRNDTLKHFTENNDRNSC